MMDFNLGLVLESSVKRLILYTMLLGIGFRCWGMLTQSYVGFFVFALTYLILDVFASWINAKYGMRKN